MAPLLLAIALFSQSGDSDEVQAFIDELDHQRASKVDALMASPKKIDRKRAREIKSGGLFAPSLYFENELRPFGQLRADEANIASVDENGIVVELKFFTPVKRRPRGGTVSATEMHDRIGGGGGREPEKITTVKLLRIEGIDTSKYADDDKFNSEQLFQVVGKQQFNGNTIHVLKPFDVKQVEERQKAQKRKPTKR